MRNVFTIREEFGHLWKEMKIWDRIKTTEKGNKVPEGALKKLENPFNINLYSNQIIIRIIIQAIFRTFSCSN